MTTKHKKKSSEFSRSSWDLRFHPWNNLAAVGTRFLHAHRTPAYLTYPGCSSCSCQAIVWIKHSAKPFVAWWYVTCLIPFGFIKVWNSAVTNWGPFSITAHPGRLCSSKKVFRDLAQYSVKLWRMWRSSLVPWSIPPLLLGGLYLRISQRNTSECVPGNFGQLCGQRAKPYRFHTCCQPEQFLVSC